MANTGLLVDISDPGGGDRGGALGPLNLRRGRNSLASSHPKTLEVNIKYLDTFLDQSSYLYCYFVTSKEEDDPFGLLDRAKETR